MVTLNGASSQPIEKWVNQGDVLPIKAQKDCIKKQSRSLGHSRVVDNQDNSECKKIMRALEMPSLSRLK